MSLQADKFPEISLIVPVYNVEKYLDECLSSIAAQTFASFECIMVNDGSTDSSAEICTRFAKSDPRFILVTRTNGGLSAARNTGLENSNGKYIGFVDSDDWLDAEYLATLYSLITQHKADVAQVGYFREYDSFSRTKSLVSELTTYRDNRPLIELLKDKHVPSYAWNKLYRRGIISSEFPIGKAFEDIYTLTEWFENVKTLVADPTPLYHYRMRSGSIINSNFAKNRIDYLTSCVHRADVMMRISPEAFTADRRNAYLLKAAIGGAKSIARLERDRHRRIHAINQISDKIAHLPKPTIKSLGIKKWLRATLLRNHPRVFTWLMRIVYLTDFQSRHRLRHLFN